MTFSDNFQRMIETSRGGVGQWIIVRHFSNTRSEYWNEKAQESIGGPPNTYTDTIILAAKQIAFEMGRPPAKAGVDVLQAVNTEIDTFKFFFDANVPIKVDDEIFDLDASGTDTPTVDYMSSGTGSPIIGRYKVNLVNVYRVGNRGEKTYTVAIAKRYYAE